MPHAHDRRRLLWPALLALALLSALGPLHPSLAAAGDLDPTFGTGGKLTTALTFPAAGGAAAAATQADGRLVVAGLSSTAYAAIGDFVLARYTADGQLDPSFGTGGLVATDFVGGASSAHAVLIQSDGQIVAAGTLALSDGSFATRFALARYLPDGRLDPSFGTGGRVTTTVLSGSNGVNALALQPDGKIVAAGLASTQLAAQRRFALARYLPDGRLDPSFGTGGTLVTAFANNSDSVAYGLVIQADGKLVAGGNSTLYSGNSNEYFALARYLPDGTLDPTFGAGGLVLSDFGQVPGPEGYALALQPDGKLLAGGLSTFSSASSFAVARYLSNGSLDSTFGSGGRVFTGFNSNVPEAVNSLLVQGDGRIVAAGITFGSTTQSDFAIARYLPDGTLDRTFQGTGKVTTDFAAGSDDATAAILQPSGRLIVLGVATLPNPDHLTSFALAGYQADGTLDPSFGNGGVTAILPPTHGASQAQAVALQPDGKIVAVGSATTGCTSQGCEASGFAVVRYTPAGSLDSTFGMYGRVSTIINNADQATAVALQPDGRILVGGVTYTQTTGNRLFAVARYLADGRLDSGFGQGGIVTTALEGQDYLAALLVQGDGKIVVGGRAGTYAAGDFGLVRYNPDGSLDATFGTGGIVLTDFGGPYDTATALALQPDGKILAAGGAVINNSADFALVRYNADGSVDPSFGANGQVHTDFAGGQDGAAAVVLQPDGRIVAAGSTGPGQPTAFALARYLPDGTPDPAFGTAGQVVTPLGSGGATAQGLTLQRDGKLVAAGQTGRYPSRDFALARYSPAGALDASFGAGGVVLTDFGNSDDAAYSITSQADGQVVAAGVAHNDFALARYETDVVGAPTNTPTPPSPTATGEPATSTPVPPSATPHPPATTPTLPSATPRPLATATPCTSSFSDVRPADYFYTPVLYLACQGSISGYTDGTFRPYNNTTRAQMVKIVVLGFGWPLVTPAPGGYTFADVPPTFPFFSVIETAAAAHIVSGYVCGGSGEPCDAQQRPYFRPFANVTRGQLSKIDAGAAGWPLQTPASPTFRDVAPGSAFYPFVETAVCHGVISGYADGTFHPGANATRGQIAKIIYLSVSGGGSGCGGLK